MTQVTDINRQALTKIIRPKIEEKLAEVAKELGMKISIGSGSYGGSTGSLKIELATVSEDGEVMTRERKAFLDYHELYGLPREALDAEIKISGYNVTIAGIKTRAPKNNVLLDLTDGSGRQLVGPAESVAAAYRLAYPNGKQA